MAEDPPLENPAMASSKLEISPLPESTLSVKNFRSGKTLSEKIRELGIKPHTRKTSSLHNVELKFEENRSSEYTIIVPNLNLEQVVYFQPEISYDEANPEKNFYRITQQDRTSKKQSNVSRISDIEVKSYKPRKTIKFRAKRRSSLMNKVEHILNTYRSPTVSKDPSEESIELPAPRRPKDMNDLPESVLQKIFLHFTLAERNLILSSVCKSWYYILKDPMFWTEMEFGPKADKNTILSLLKRYPSATKLKLVCIEGVVDILQEICRFNNIITDLAVKYCNVNVPDFSRVIHRVITCCTNLEVLDIKGMSFQSEGFYLDLGRLKNLRSINLSGNPLLRSQDLITLSVNCRNLEEFKVLDISLDFEQGPSLRDEDITFIFSHLQTKLRTIKLDMQQLRNLSYQAVLKCSKLTNLGLKNCLYLSSDAFRQFNALRQLRKLKITRGINLKMDDFLHVFGNGNLSKIENLDINGCWGVGEIGLRAIAAGLPSLRRLSLKNCKSIRGRHLVHLSRCPLLSELNLAHTGVESAQLPSLYQYVKGLEVLVIDTTMHKQSMIRQLKRFYPSLKIVVSFSEFQKDEKFLYK